MPGLDVFGINRIISECLSYLQNARLEDCLLNVRFRPYRFQQFLFGYESACIVNEISQHRERFWRELNRFVATLEVLVLGVERVMEEPLHPSSTLRIRCRGFNLAHCDGQNYDKTSPFGNNV